MHLPFPKRVLEYPSGHDPDIAVGCEVYAPNVFTLTTGSTGQAVEYTNVKWSYPGFCSHYPSEYVAYIPPQCQGIYMIIASAYIYGAGSTAGTGRREISLWSDRLGEICPDNACIIGAGDSRPCLYWQGYLSDGDGLWTQVAQTSGADKSCVVDGTTTGFTMFRVGTVMTNRPGPLYYY